MPAVALAVALTPIQDLHGYDHPWAGGRGKNLLPMTVAGIKAVNANGTWSGNTYTHRNVTFTILTDSDDNVIGINATGTATGDSPSFYLGKNISLADGNYILNGCPANGSVLTYCMIAEWSGGDVKDLGSGISLSVSGNTIDVRIRIQQDYAITSGGITFYPMIRLSTESDATFAPYSNICPISGRISTSASTTDGEDTESVTIAFGTTVYGGSVNFNTGVVTVTHAIVDLGDFTWNYVADIVGFYTDDIVSTLKKPASNLEPINAICEVCPVVARDAVTEETLCANVNGRIIYKTSMYGSNAAIFTTAMDGMHLCYELTAPTTLTLTPDVLTMLKGDNSVSGDGVITITALTGDAWGGDTI